MRLQRIGGIKVAPTREAAPVNSLKIFGTGLAGIASMLLPLVHVVFKE
jgi:hypothetical protein